MADLSTDYLGLRLANPLVPSASPLSRDLDTARRLRDAGAPALVMYSLFEEKIEQEEQQLARFFHQQAIGHAEADSFHPVPADYNSYLDAYLEQLRQLKGLGIPIIASLNGITLGGWVEYGKLLEEAGADALELNVYYIAANLEESSSEVEQRYIEILRQLRNQVSIPITMKLSSQFSSPLHFVRRLEEAGAAGVALFNRFYLPDIDLETLAVSPTLSLSSSREALLRVRWTALLHGRVNLSLAVTGGFHTAADMLKALLAGADVTHLCSVLLQQGPQHLARVLEDMNRWLDEHEYSSIRQLKGSLSQQHAIDPAAYERVNYISVLDNYTTPPGVLR